MISASFGIMCSFNRRMRACVCIEGADRHVCVRVEGTRRHACMRVCMYRVQVGERA